MSSPSLQPVQLTSGEAKAFLADFARIAGNPATGTIAVVDLSALQSFDSAGLAALVNIAPKAQLLHAPEKLRKLAALYGMGRIFS